MCIIYFEVSTIALRPELSQNCHLGAHANRREDVTIIPAHMLLPHVHVGYIHIMPLPPNKNRQIIKVETADRLSL
jgi:hypothetical protein